MRRFTLSEFYSFLQCSSFFIHQISSLRFLKSQVTDSHCIPILPVSFHFQIQSLDLTLTLRVMICFPAYQELDATIHFGIDATVLGLPLSGRFARIVAWQNNRQLAQWCLGSPTKGKASEVVELWVERL